MQNEIATLRPSVSIIIPVHNQWEYTKACILSVKENSAGIDYEIILADDLSTDATRDAQDHFPEVVHIKNEENLGFLRNCNKAAGHARGKYLLFLNNDTTVRENWLRHLLDLIEKDDRIGMVGSKLIYPDGTLQEAGGIIWNDASGQNYGRDDDPEKPEYNYVKDVDYISGACILIRKSLWEKIGGFDERFTPAYYEDTDLAFTVREMGYRVVLQPKSVVVHYEGKSHGTDLSSGIKSYQVRNKEIFLEKWKEVLARDHFGNGEHVFWARDRSIAKKTVVFIDYQVPHFDTFAGSRTNHMYLKLLVDMGLNVKLIGATFRRDEPYTTDLEQKGIEVLYGEVIYGDQAGDRWHRDSWQNWIIKNSDHIDYFFLNKPDTAAIYLDFIKERCTAAIIYQGHDLHYLRLKRTFEVEQDPELLIQSAKYEKLEYEIINKSDVILTFSEYEAGLMKQKAMGKVIFTVPLFFYDTFPMQLESLADKKNLLYVGGFGHAPNIDAVRWFATSILPDVLHNFPDLLFNVVGANPPEEILALASANVRILGQLSDEELCQQYRQARVAVVPLRYGAGVKGKTLEAMHFGVPLISTTIGIEGLTGLEEVVRPVDTAEDFAAEIIRVYSDDTALNEMRSRALRYLKKHFSSVKANETMTQVLSAGAEVKSTASKDHSCKEAMNETRRARLISFYLPQFHPIPENDSWWGKGFTEWTNVSKTKALFEGHQQPVLPTELGFYDLRLPEAREDQAKLAREHGIEAFCYWHYWFHGKRLIERPFNEVLNSQDPDFSFCLAWANETWSRRWLGEERDVLMAQTYSPEDDLDHIRWLLPVFADRRCVKINGRPLFLIYRPTDLPDPKRTTDLFRSECVRHGLKEPFLIGINSHCWDVDCRTLGFDGTLLFMPQLGNLSEFMNDEPSESKRLRNLRFGVQSDKLKIYDYEESLVSMLSNRERYDHPVYPSIFVGWDNTPRRGENGIILVNSTPQIFGKHLSALIEEVQTAPPDERLVFINAWNEWAEGNHLEPDNWRGRGYLEEILKVNGPLPITETCSGETVSISESKTIASAPNSLRTIAFHLPQYHPIPENDEWWGKGFTEWTNVAKAQPLFPGHYQPHLPADLGFYDLRLAEARKAQAELAREHGVTGFCYYHYWFNGRLLLETPLHAMLASGEPEFPFCLCWANEPWTRSWDGRSGEILLEQKYSQEDDIEHIQYLSRFFSDHRYIKVHGKPLLLVYRAGEIPDPAKTAETWRKEARRLGIGEIYLCRVESFPKEHSNPADIGFDANIEFQPDWTNLGEKLSGDQYEGLSVFDYQDVVRRMMNKADPGYKRFQCVTPGWDNSPRKGRKNPYIFINSTPQLYQTWLYTALKRAQKLNAPEEQIVFINAWNEWGEGNHLEPDEKTGRAYLAATNNALRHAIGSPEITDIAKNLEQLINKLKALPEDEHSILTLLSYSSDQLAPRLLQLMQHERTLTEYQHQLAEQERHLANRIQYIGDMEQQLGENETLLAQHTQQLAEKEQRIVDLLNSQSWKITAPLRKVLDLLVGFKSLIF